MMGPVRSKLSEKLKRRSGSVSHTVDLLPFREQEPSIGGELVQVADEGKTTGPRRIFYIRRGLGAEQQGEDDEAAYGHREPSHQTGGYEVWRREGREIRRKVSVHGWGSAWR